MGRSGDRQSCEYFLAPPAGSNPNLLALAELLISRPACEISLSLRTVERRYGPGHAGQPRNGIRELMSRIPAVLMGGHRYTSICGTSCQFILPMPRSWPSFK
jgi:hypothetical protein